MAKKGKTTALPDSRITSVEHLKTAEQEKLEYKINTKIESLTRQINSALFSLNRVKQPYFSFFTNWSDQRKLANIEMWKHKLNLLCCIKNNLNAHPELNTDLSDAYKLKNPLDFTLAFSGRRRSVTQTLFQAAEQQGMVDKEQINKLQQPSAVSAREYSR